MTQFSRALLVALIALALPACSSFSSGDDDDVPYVEKPPEDIYEEAVAALADGRNSRAAKLFNEVERQHPYSEFSPKSQINAAFAHYQDLAYDDAILVLDRFIRLHPGHEDVAYAYYLRGLSYYEQISDVGRDQEMTRLAQESFDELLRRFPDSEYARDAQLKRDLTLDHLAGKEMEIGRYYLAQRHYNAALKRFATVVASYQTTTHIPEALHRITEVYVALGLPEEAKRYAAVLGHNFPGSDWYANTYDLMTAEGYQPDRDSGFGILGMDLSLDGLL